MIYLDNAATTFPSEEALAAFAEEARLGANPSSMHAAGFAAHKRLEEARASFAVCIGAKAEEIVFTSGGTESANLAILGAVRAKRRRGNRILVSDAEHPCVSETLKDLAADGFEIVKISTKGGCLNLDQIKAGATESVILCCFMHTNNETGAVYDVASAFRIVRAQCPHALCFCDCVQALGKTPLNVSALGTDLASFSAHKIHALRGVGALYVKAGVRLVTPIHGGGQEKGLRSGTENTPAILAFAAAAKRAIETLPERTAHMARLKDKLSRSLAELDGVQVLGGFPASCHIVSAAFSGYKSEVLLHLLSDLGVCVSSGSACSSKKGAKSPILLAHGVSPAAADSTLRFSLCHNTTEEEIDQTLSMIRQLLQKGLYRR
ncbi:MAG: cysteine desulfurase [Clostridia bacterium]|nr:cysteine desulfurase [Clostridia bacterium]